MSCTARDEVGLSRARPQAMVSTRPCREERCYEPSSGKRCGEKDSHLEPTVVNGKRDNLGTVEVAPNSEGSEYVWPWSEKNDMCNDPDDKPKHFRLV